MDKKELYQSPTTDVFVVQIEGVVCLSTGDTSIPALEDGTDFPIVF